MLNISNYSISKNKLGSNLQLKFTNFMITTVNINKNKNISVKLDGKISSEKIIYNYTKTIVFQ